MKADESGRPREGEQLLQNSPAKEGVDTSPVLWQHQQKERPGSCALGLVGDCEVSWDRMCFPGQGQRGNKKGNFPDKRPWKCEMQGFKHSKSSRAL